MEIITKNLRQAKTLSLLKRLNKVIIYGKIIMTSPIVRKNMAYVQIFILYPKHSFIYIAL